MSPGILAGAPPRAAAFSPFCKTPPAASASNLGIRVGVKLPCLRSCSKTPTPLGDELLPNARRLEENSLSFCGGFTLGVDLGDARTGVALGKGFSPRPLAVLNLRGEKLERRLIKIASEEEVDEFVVGLPISISGTDTQQSIKVRSFAGRLAVRAAEHGWRLYLQDEHGTSLEAIDRMMDMGVKRSSLQGEIDAYAAVMLLERYFSTSGEEAQLVLPKKTFLREKLLKGPPRDPIFLT